MRRLSATLVLVASVGTANGARAQVDAGWTISNSPTDPWSNTGPIAPGPTQFAGNLYLWLLCALDGGMASAEFDVVEQTGVGPPVGFTPLNGFLNAGTPTALLLSAAACPAQDVLAGSFSVPADGLVPDIELCIVPSAANNRNVTVSCLPETTLQNRTIGFRKSTPATCAHYQTCAVTSVEEGAWGRIKTRYR